MSKAANYIVQAVTPGHGFGKTSARAGMKMEGAVGFLTEENGGNEGQELKTGKLCTMELSNYELTRLDGVEKVANHQLMGSPKSTL